MKSLLTVAAVLVTFPCVRLQLEVIWPEDEPVVKNNTQFKKELEVPIVDYIKSLKTMVDTFKKQLQNGELDDTVMTNNVVTFNGLPEQLIALKDFILKNGILVGAPKRLKKFEKSVEDMNEIIDEVTHDFVHLRRRDVSRYGRTLEKMIRAFKNWVNHINTDIPGLNVQVTKTAQELLSHKITGAFAQLFYDLWVKNNIQ